MVVKDNLAKRFVAFTFGFAVLGTSIVASAQPLPEPPPPPPPERVQPPPPQGAQDITPPVGTTLPPPPPPPQGVQSSVSSAETNPPVSPPLPPLQPQPSNTTDASSVAWEPVVGPATLSYKDNEPTPPGYRPVMRNRRGLAIAGGFVFGVPYLLSVVDGISNVSSHDASPGLLLIPVVGPFILAGTNEDSGFLSGLANVVYVFDGIVQTAGMVMLIAGIVSSRKVLVRDDIAKVVRPEFFVGPRSIGMKLTF